MDLFADNRSQCFLDQFGIGLVDRDDAHGIISLHTLLVEFLDQQRDLLVKRLGSRHDQRVTASVDT